MATIELSTYQNQRILVSALNWGMGHVTRTCGLIKALSNFNNSFVIACDLEQKALFISLLTDSINIQFEEHAGYPFSFHGTGEFQWDVIKKSGAMFKRDRLERQEVEKLCKKHAITLVLSDHRYAFYSKRIPSVFITHQLYLPLNRGEYFIQIFHRMKLWVFQKKQNQIWIMDNEENPLAGKLSFPPIKKASYIGHYSSFETPKSLDENFRFDILAIISGPSPYNQQLLDQVILTYGAKTANIDKPEIDKLQVGVLTTLETASLPENFTVFRFPCADVRNQLFAQAGKIVSRSGYTTLMDCALFNKKLEAKATPGQTEQLYLDKLMAQRNEANVLLG